jgi:Tripartite tricarboxylate transporter TctB family
MVGECRARSARAGPPGSRAGVTFNPCWKRFWWDRKVGALLVVLGGYVFLLDSLGYLLSTFLLVLFMLRWIDTQRWAIALGMAAITSAGSYVVFAIWLSIPLPRGPL